MPHGYASRLASVPKKKKKKKNTHTHTPKESPNFSRHGTTGEAAALPDFLLEVLEPRRLEHHLPVLHPLKPDELDGRWVRGGVAARQIGPCGVGGHNGVVARQDDEGRRLRRLRSRRRRVRRR